MYKKIWRMFTGGCMVVAVSLAAQASPAPAAGVVAPAIVPVAKEKSTTDHGQLEALKGPFTSGPEVTKACLTCHTFNAHQPSGSRYAPTAKDSHGMDLPKDDHNRATCESRHGATPHKEAKIIFCFGFAIRYLSLGSCEAAPPTTEAPW